MGAATGLIDGESRVYSGFIVQKEDFRLHQELVRCISVQRARQELSQERLALRAGLHRNTVRLIETGQVDPTFSCVSRVMSALGTVSLSFSRRSVEAEIAPDPEDFFDAVVTHYANRDRAWIVTVPGHAIRERRLLVGLSQEKLAQNAGVSLNTIGRFERGEVDPNLSTIMAVYRALQIGRVEVRDFNLRFY